MKEYFIKKLDNGLTLVLINYQNLNSVYFDLAIKTGARYEKNKNTGTAHLAEHLIFKKSVKSLNNHQWLKHYIYEDFNAYSLVDRTNYEFFCYYKDVQDALNLIKKIINPSLITMSEFEAEKEIIFEEIVEYSSNIDFQWSEVIDRYYFRNQPVGYEVLGRNNYLKGLGFEEFNQYLKQYYKPENMVLTIAGKINPQQILKVIKKKFVSKKNTAVNSFESFKYQGNKIDFVEKNIKQNYFGFFYPIYNNSAKENLKWEFLIEILRDYLFEIVIGKVPCYTFSMDGRVYNEFLNLGIEAVFQPHKSVDFYKQFKMGLRRFLKDFTPKDFQYIKENKLKKIELELDDFKANANMLGWQVFMYGEKQVYDFKKQANLIKNLEIDFVKEYFKKLFINNQGTVLFMGKLSIKQKREIFKIWENWNLK